MGLHCLTRSIQHKTQPGERYGRVFFFLAGSLSTAEVFNYPIYVDVRNRQLWQISFCVNFYISMVPGQYDLRSWPNSEQNNTEKQA
jgi:hypothetical protein